MKILAIFQKCFRQTDRPTNRPTDIAASIVAFTRLKRWIPRGWMDGEGEKEEGELSPVSGSISHWPLYGSCPKRNREMYLSKTTCHLCHPKSQISKT